MIKGCQKKIIQVKDTKSPFFEEAYFVLKKDIDSARNEKVDIVSEATSIINRYSPSAIQGKNRKGIALKLIFFICGAILGASLMGAISFLFL